MEGVHLGYWARRQVSFRQHTGGGFPGKGLGVGLSDARVRIERVDSPSVFNSLMMNEYSEIGYTGHNILMNARP